MLCSLLGGIMTFQDFLIGVLVLLVGATFCFVGYRFFRILIAVWGFFAGFNLCAAAMTALFGQNFLGTTTGWILVAQLRTMQEYTLVWAETQVPGGSSNV
jgi:hypothetical protein